MPAASTRGSAHARAQRQDQGQAAGPEPLAEDRAAGAQDPQRPRLVHVGEEHRDGLLGRAALGGEQALDGVGQRDVRGDPVDRVGGHGDDAAGPQQRHGLGARGVAVRQDSRRRPEPVIGRARLAGRPADRRPDRPCLVREPGGVARARRRAGPAPASSTSAAAPSASTGAAMYRAAACTSAGAVAIAAP